MGGAKEGMRRECTRIRANTKLVGGAIYARLQAIKASVDLEGRFGCWHCVELPGGAGAEEAAAVMRSAS